MNRSRKNKTVVTLLSALAFSTSASAANVGVKSSSYESPQSTVAVNKASAGKSLPNKFPIWAKIATGIGAAFVLTEGYNEVAGAISGEEWYTGKHSIVNHFRKNKRNENENKDGNENKENLDGENESKISSKLESTENSNQNQNQKKQVGFIVPNLDINPQFQNMSKFNNPNQFNNPNIKPNVNISMNMFGQYYANQNMFQNQQAKLIQSYNIWQLINNENNMREDIKQAFSKVGNDPKILQIAQEGKNDNKLKKIITKVINGELSVINYQYRDNFTFNFQVFFSDYTYSFTGRAFRSSDCFCLDFFGWEGSKYGNTGDKDCFYIKYEAKT